MPSKTYTAGFMDKLAELNKSAKMWYEMSDDEKARAQKADALIDILRKKNIPTRIKEYTKPETAIEWLDHLGKKTGRKAISLGRGALSTAGVTGVRAIEGLADLATFVPGLIDSLVFGRLAGVDDGRGYLGRILGNGHRLADSTVNKLRRWSEDYDYKNRITSGFNRFTQGAGADALGTFIGFGGLAGVGRKGIAKLVAPAFGALGASSALTDGQHKQLRDREAKIRNIDPRFWQYIDPTATAYNKENAPTLQEYKRYHLPSKNLPTSYTGKIRIPWSWRHMEDGSPTQFIDYGE